MWGNMGFYSQLRANFSNLMVSVGGAILAAIPLGLVFLFITWPAYQAKIEKNKKDMVKVAVESVFEILQTYYEKQVSLEMTPQQAQLAAMNVIKKLRYSGSEYFWINNQEPKMIMHPFKPELDGKNLAETKDPQGKKIFMEMVDVSKKQGSGYVEYMWPKPGEKDSIPKVSYIKFFKPWGWIIGSGVYQDDILLEVQKARKDNFFWMMLATFVAVGISFLIGLRQLVKIIFPVQNVIYSLNQEANQLMQTAENLSVTSQNLSRSVQDQSSSVHQTTQTMGQISDLIAKASQSSEASFKLADETKEVAGRGLSATQKLSESMNDIHKSQEILKDTLNENLKKLSEVTAIINQISDKTHVINDIVFQTKLLSFNASVEAARAGEAGKGFAVVAEEVGKLAEMSGSAALEISTIVQSSNKRVVDLTEDIKKDLGSVISEVGLTIQEGLVHSKTSLEMLAQVVQMSTHSSQMSQSISSSSQAQKQGTEEVSAAMKVVEKSSETISSTAVQTEFSSENLVHQVAHLREITSSLSSIVSHTAA